MAAIAKRRSDDAKRRRRASGFRLKDTGAQRTTDPKIPDEPGPFDPAQERVAQDGRAIEGLLDQTSDRLRTMPETPRRRELALVVERYRRALADWSSYAPTPVQRVILLDCARALRDRVLSRSRRDPVGG